MLPYVDEHMTWIDTDAEQVWRALLSTLDRLFLRPGAAAYAQAVGCVDRVAAGPRPLSVGSAVPGFYVTAACPDQELVLEGRHRFSTYALTFRLCPLGPHRTALTAETRAAFPGPAGRLYRLLVLRTGAHVIGVRRLLAAVRREAQAAP